MKLEILFVFMILCVGCNEKPPTANNNISTEWIGHTLVIKRKEFPILEVTNVSNAFFVNVSGTDRAPDLMVEYFEDDVSGLAPVPKTVERLLYGNEGSTLITYDNQGKIIEEIPIPVGANQDSEPGAAGQPATRSKSK